MAESNVKDLLNEFKSSCDEVANTHKKAAGFLRKFRSEFNNQLENDANVAVEVVNPIFKFDESFPIYFDLLLSISQGDNKGKFTLPCTAKEISENVYLINDGHGQHNFYLDDGHPEINARTFSKLSDNFTGKFREREDLTIDINKK